MGNIFIAMLFLLRQYEICVFHFCLFCLFACTMGNTEVRKSGFIIGHTRYTFYSLQFCVVIRSFNNRFKSEGECMIFLIKLLGILLGFAFPVFTIKAIKESLQ